MSRQDYRHSRRSYRDLSPQKRPYSYDSDRSEERQRRETRYRHSSPHEDRPRHHKRHRSSQNISDDDYPSRYRTNRREGRRGDDGDHPTTSSRRVPRVEYSSSSYRHSERRHPSRHHHTEDVDDEPFRPSSSARNFEQGRITKDDIPGRVETSNGGLCDDADDGYEKWEPRKVSQKSLLEQDEEVRRSGVKESEAERRDRMRRNSRHAPVWGRSPSPPANFEDRLDNLGDERVRKERKRIRKEERARRREAKRARRKAREARANEKEGEGVNVVNEEEEKEESSGPDDDVGPQALDLEKKDGKGDEPLANYYGKALRPGEGSAMAAFVADGKRIPRRGEIGLESNEISAFEKVGYVMSGSRNRRMEAVRLRKENQVYSAEELAALSQFSHEERKLQQERTLKQFRSLVDAKMGRANNTARPNNKKE